MKSTLLGFIRDLASDTRGVTALLFGLMLIPLLLAVGVGVDYARATQIRTMLQSTADGAALAGASAYTSSSAQTSATALATAYVTKGTGALPSSVTITSTTVTPGSSSSVYTMQVGITASVPTTLMYLWKPAMTVTVSATASNPVVTASFDMGGFVSYACDINEIYWYIVPPGGGVPDASAMNLLWNNNTPSPTGTATFQVSASSQIGFAIKNVTGARDPSLGGCNYGNNMYGAHPGDTQWLYSHMQPPSASYNIAPGGANTGTNAIYETTQDCALVVEQGKLKNGTWTYPNAPQNKCFTASGKNENSYNQGRGTFCYNCVSGPKMSAEMTNAAPSCSQLGGTSYQYDWNDMGAGVDNLNYGNDMQYSFSCSGGSGSGNGTGTTGVVLTN